MNIGVEVPLFSDIRLLGKPLDSNTALLWVGALILISIHNLKTVNLKDAKEMNN